MTLLYKSAVQERLRDTSAKRLTIQPLLDEAQIGEVSIDLRLGPDFLVSVLTRKAFIGTVHSDPDFRGTQSFFQSTRREIGDRFMLYPNQIVLACTLEYIGIPDDLYVDIISRSSYSRMGIQFACMIQPGFRGCFPLELINHGNNPVELVVGSRICQARIHRLGQTADYGAASNTRKYFGNIRPMVSRAADDEDVQILDRIKEKR